MIILLFGQPASGKTTLSNKLISYFNDFKNANELIKLFGNNSSKMSIQIDGDKWRDVTKNKDYSKEGRLKNLKGAFDMAIYLEREGFQPILSFVTPYDELRQYLNDNSNLVEIYLEYNEDRGRNMNFANDFEIPTIECLRMNTSDLSIDECFGKIIDYIRQKTN